jgi:tetratricopeptide (TPR) repeat protein
MKLLVFAMLARLASAQSPPAADLMPTMQAMAQALGVRCEYCHSAPRGSGQPEPKKEIARVMMAMTRDLNARIQSATGKPAAETTNVQCVTCHRGVAIPAQLSDILTRTLREKGSPAAVEQYRELRRQYYGRQSYDFGEATLLDLAQRIASARPDDAIALLKLNIEFNPRSVPSYSALAYAYTRKLDDASAITILQKALEIEPDNGIVRGQLEQLQSYQRRK